MNLDPQKEALFIALALEFGQPKPLRELRVRMGKKLAHSELDVRLVTRLAQLANTAGITLTSPASFDSFYAEYEAWYENENSPF